MDVEWTMPEFEDVLSLADVPELPVSQTPELGSLSLERLLSAGHYSGIMADDELSMPAVKLELSDVDSMPVSELPAPSQTLFKLEEGVQPTAGIAPSAFVMTSPPTELVPPTVESSPTPELTASSPTTKRTRRPLGAPRRPLGAPRRAPSPSPSDEAHSKRAKADVSRESSPSPSAVPRDPNDKEQYIKEKNRDAARLFRQRRKDYLRNLEDELRRTQDKQAALEARARELEAANAALRNSAQAANQRLEQQELELQHLRSTAALSSSVADAAVAAAPASPARSEHSAARSITIPPMSELKESLDVRQLAQVVVCLMIIANIVGPIAGWDIPTVTEALPTAADVVLSATATADTACKAESQKAEDEAAAAATSSVEGHSDAPSPAAQTSTAIDATSPSSVDLNSAPAKLISSYLTAMDPTLLAYLVMSAHKARTGSCLEAVAAASS